MRCGIVAPIHADHAVYGGELETLPADLGSFDCVTAFDVIEHQSRPSADAGRDASFITPGGLAVVSTHDIGNLFARLYGASWRHIHPIGHLTYFTRITLTKMLASAGLRVVRCGSLHTLDASVTDEVRNWLTQFGKVILLRALILGLYRPLADHVSACTHWHFTWRGLPLDHSRLMTRVGRQIIMNDAMILFAVAA